MSPDLLRRARRCCAYAWALPCTALGSVFGAMALMAGGSSMRIHGTLEVALPCSARRFRWPFDAITFGHVIIGTSHDVLAALRAHEQVHVRQYERWGAFFLLAYPLASAWEWLRGRDAYWHNVFEVEARAGATMTPDTNAVPRT
jgi:hypothetical protein